MNLRVFDFVDKSRRHSENEKIQIEKLHLAEEKVWEYPVEEKTNIYILRKNKLCREFRRDGVANIQINFFYVSTISLKFVFERINSYRTAREHCII